MLRIFRPNPPFRDEDEEGGEVLEEVDPNLLDDECLGNLALSLSRHAKTLKMFSLSLNPWFGDQAHTRLSTKGYSQIGESLMNCSNIENLLLLYLEYDYFIDE